MLTSSLLYVVLVLFFGGAFVSLAAGRSAMLITCATSVAAGIVGLFFSFYLLLFGATADFQLSAFLPLGSVHLYVDRLSAVFLPPVFLLCVVAGVLLPGRLKKLAEEQKSVLAFGRHCCFFNLFMAGMVLTLTASDSVLFLISWEIMSLMPFFLISPLDKDSSERFAVWIYITAAHLGVLPLLLLFAGMGVEAGGTDFFLFANHNQWMHANIYFVAALLGFGLKAGLAPLHVWMPEAHTSAPGHVAVLLSGATLNVGLYGILRIFYMIGQSEVWWAYALMGIGAFSGVVGILFGLVQSDIKRTLAYSSAEHMGIICLALGGALIADKNGVPAGAALLMAGALLHIWNHSIFKSLLFLAANAVKESAHTTLIQRLGGLQKCIPFTGSCFAMGSAAIAGVPPLNGFMSELLMFMGFAIVGKSATTTEYALLFWGAFFVLGGVVGMSLFAFVRTYGLTFLGSPRSQHCSYAYEPEFAFKGMMLFLCLLCLFFSFIGPMLLAVFKPFLIWSAVETHLSFGVSTGFNWYVPYVNGISLGSDILAGYAKCSLVLVGVFIFVRIVHRGILDKNGVVGGATWACGYRCPTARMQYSSTSFSRTFSLLLKTLVRTKIKTSGVEGLFPKEEKLTVTSPDWAITLWSKLIFSPVDAVAGIVKNLQTGLVNIYILYVFLALVMTLIWALGWA